MLNNKYDLAGQYLDMANSGTLTEEEKNRKLGYINNALSIDGQQQLQQRKNAAMTALMGSDWNQPGGGGLASAIGGNSGRSPYTALFGQNNNFGSSNSFGGGKMFQPSMGFAEGGLVPPPQYLAQGGQAMPFTGPQETLADDKTIYQDPVFQQAQRWASNNAMQDMRMQRDGMSSTAQELSATRRIDDQQWGNRLADRGIGFEIIPYGKSFRTRPQRFALPPVNEHGQYFAHGGVVGMHPGEPKGTDTVPAWLTPGEAVLTPQATQAIGGKPAVDTLNSIGKGGLYAAAQQRGLPPVRSR